MSIPTHMRALEVTRRTGTQARRGFKSLWPNGPVVTLPGVGHFVPEDALEPVTALLRSCSPRQETSAK